MSGVPLLPQAYTRRRSRSSWVWKIGIWRKIQMARLPKKAFCMWLSCKIISIPAVRSGHPCTIPILTGNCGRSEMPKYGAMSQAGRCPIAPPFRCARLSAPPLWRGGGAAVRRSGGESDDQPHQLADGQGQDAGHQSGAGNPVRSSDKDVACPFLLYTVIIIATLLVESACPFHPDQPLAGCRGDR